MSTKMVEIEGEVVHQTDDAYLFYDGKTKDWIPKSKVDDECEEEGVITSIFIPEWLALDKGFI